MGSARIMLNFLIDDDRWPDTAIPSAIEILLSDVVRPISVRVLTPSDYFWVEGSLDAGMIDGADEALLCGECDVPDLNLTGLRSDVAMEVCRKVEDGLSAVSERAGRGTAAPAPYLSVNMFGITNVLAPRDRHALGRDWFLRERHVWSSGSTSYLEILEVQIVVNETDSRAAGRNSLQLSSLAEVFSPYQLATPESRFLRGSGDFIEAITVNCEVLASRVAEFVESYSGVSWFNSSEHLPPVEEVLVHALTHRIGPPRNQDVLERRIGAWNSVKGRPPWTA